MVFRKPKTMETEEKVVATETTEETKGSEAPSQEKPKRSEAETTAYNLKRQAEKARELGLDPADVLGIKPKLEIDSSVSDDEPLTVGKLRELNKRNALDEAISLADSIEDETERDAVREMLKTRIVPSGNAQADFSLARAAISSTRNSRIAEEIARKKAPTRTAAGGSVAEPPKDDFEPTPEEAIFMRPPYNLSKEKILAKRKAQ